MTIRLFHPTLEELIAAATPRAAMHAAACRRCRETLDVIERLDRFARAPQSGLKPPHVIASVLAERARPATRVASSNERRRPRSRLNAAWAMAAAAAAVVAFVAGVGVGRANGPATLAVPNPDTHRSDVAPLSVAFDVQRRGSAYIASLVALRQSRGGDPSAIRQGYQSALATLHAAAIELRPVAPDADAATDLSAVANLAVRHAERAERVDAPGRRATSF